MRYAILDARGAVCGVVFGPDDRTPPADAAGQPAASDTANPGDVHVDGVFTTPAAPGGD